MDLGLFETRSRHALVIHGSADFFFVFFLLSELGIKAVCSKNAKSNTQNVNQVKHLGLYFLLENS